MRVKDLARRTMTSVLMMRKAMMKTLEVVVDLLEDDVEAVRHEQRVVVLLLHVFHCCWNRVGFGKEIRQSVRCGSARLNEDVTGDWLSNVGGDVGIRLDDVQLRRLLHDCNVFSFGN